MSVEAVHERLIWEEETVLAERAVGADGGVVSGGVDSVVAEMTPSTPEQLL